MGSNEKIDIDVFKVVIRAINESDNLDIMTNHMVQLLVSALEIKGATIFVLNPESGELERLASFGMSMGYLHKGPVVFDRSIGCVSSKDSIVIGDVAASDRLQYPEEALSEGIRAIVSVPILFYGDAFGALRLYHHEVWEISEKDLDSLLILAENIGLAMMYTRLLNSARMIRGAIEEFPWERVP